MLDKKPVIVALDFPDANSALDLSARLDPALCRLKVGKELHTAAGPQVVDKLMHRGFDVFLDLKFHDIPNTVASACRVAASQGVWMINVHASGGRNMLLAAREAVDFAQTKPLLIGVTVLTSLGDSDMSEIGFTGTAAEVTPIRELDRIELGKDDYVGSRGPITEKIQTAFFDIVNGRNPKYAHWLTKVSP